MHLYFFPASFEHFCTKEFCVRSDNPRLFSSRFLEKHCSFFSFLIFSTFLRADISKCAILTKKSESIIKMAMFDLQLDYSLLKIKSIDRSRHKQKRTIQIAMRNPVFLKNKSIPQSKYQFLQ